MSPDAYTEMAQMQSGHWWFVARREILRSQIGRLNLPAGADILEIGSGTGANLDLLAEFGNVVGLEMSAQAIALAGERMAASGRHITMRQGRCPEDLHGISQKFDLICLFDVLEHIEHDEMALAALARLLKPNGTLMVTVPAYSWMWGPHDVHLHHRRRYNTQVLSEGCTRAGLCVSRMTHFNALLFPLAVLGRMFEKLTRRQNVSAATPPEAVNALLARVFALERLLLAGMRLPFGLSILLLASSPRTA